MSRKFILMFQQLLLIKRAASYKAALILCNNQALLVSALLQVADGEHVLVNLCETYTLAFLDADTA